jgi:hypothetical protein
MSVNLADAAATLKRNTPLGDNAALGSCGWIIPAIFE